MGLSASEFKSGVAAKQGQWAPKASPAPTPSSSVADRRAAGTNNAARNQAAKKAGTFSGNIGKTAQTRINYDPASKGGAAFGNEDYNHLKSQGHSDSDINSYLGTLDNSQVSNAYKPQAGYTRTEQQEQNYQAAQSKTTDYSKQYDTSSPNFHTSYKSLMGNYDPASRGGAAFGNEDYDYLKSQGHSDSSINSYLRELDTTQVSNAYKTRGGHTPNASINSGRSSSEGLYQDKYSVGKGGEDDLGDTYLSQGALGILTITLKFQEILKQKLEIAGITLILSKLCLLDTYRQQCSWTRSRRICR